MVSVAIDRLGRCRALVRLSTGEYLALFEVTKFPEPGVVHKANGAVVALGVEIGSGVIRDRTSMKSYPFGSSSRIRPFKVSITPFRHWGTGLGEEQSCPHLGAPDLVGGRR